MCGVVGIALKNKKDQNAVSIAEMSAQCLSRLQHRGQDGAGLTVFKAPHEFETVKGLGLIETALKNRDGLPVTSVAVAHTRYATTGTGGVGELQPFVRGSPKVALAHNGNIVNCAELIEKFKLVVETASDLDVLQQFLLKHLALGSFEQAVQEIYNEFNGSYAVVGILDDGTLFAFRDPYGLRPLFMGESSDLTIFASETAAINPLGAGIAISEIKPGEWVRVLDGKIERGILKSRRNPRALKRFCMFENVYFSSPQSEIAGTNVYRLRFRLGSVLAEEIIEELGSKDKVHEKIDFVVPVPDTSRTAALAVAETLGLPYREFLVKNNYVPRTFILGNHEQRLKALEQKLSLIGPEIKGFKILLVDDSVVRGNTSRMMAARLREAGATQIFLASTCPPIRHGCFYGIDFPDPEELVAYERSIAEISKSLGADNLHYITIAGLKSAFQSEEFCMACLDGDYPTRDESFDTFLKSRRKQRTSGGLLA